MGCCVQIIHNNVQYASYCLPVDVDRSSVTFLVFFINILSVSKNLKNVVTMFCYV